MKFFIISDIHGSAYYLKKALQIFEKEKCDKLIILGDQLYHGPRNLLPLEYSPKEVFEILNQYKDQIIAVRGNCDSEVDQMVLKYPTMSDYSMIVYNNRKIYLTHGHIYNKNNPLPLSKGDIMIYDHFHIPEISDINGNLFLNPGSISLPKNNSEHSFAILEKNKFTIKNLEETVILETFL